MSNYVEPLVDPSAPAQTNMRITPEDIQAKIKHVEFFRPNNTTVTICCMTLANGFNVVGSGACVDPANFNAKMGEDIALANAKEQIWALEGYLLKQRMFEQE